MPLIIEVRHYGCWLTPGTPLGSGEPDGSLSHNGPAGRQIYRFGCRGEHSVIERSAAGVDAELEGGALRAISSRHFEQVAKLHAGDDPFECFLRTDRMVEPALFRFRHVR